MPITFDEVQEMTPEFLLRVALENQTSSVALSGYFLFAYGTSLFVVDPQATVKILRDLADFFETHDMDSDDDFPPHIVQQIDKMTAEYHSRRSRQQ